MKKRILTLFLALILVFGLLPATARAEAPSDGLEYIICEGHVEITGYSGNAEVVVIPATISGLPVTSINDRAFSYCDMTSISIPDSVTHIGKNAFSHCFTLTSISIPKGVTFISDHTFDYCTKLTSVSIPDSVISIGQYAFIDCKSLASISIPDSVTSIGEGAFSRCESLISVSIPDGITSISQSTFYRCKSLTSISIPDSVTSIGNNAFQNCESLTSISIPDSVTSIGKYAFQYCKSLASISIPKGVTSISNHTFSGCESLTNVIILDSVTYIGAHAFAYCDNLASIYFDGNAPEFDGNVFYETTTNAYYPFKNPTWTIMQGYGGNISWVPYTPPFYDVLASSFYADPVLWAVENGITTGATADSFNPNGQCLRAQVVTFLHRTAENPEPTASSNPFTDVKSTDFFYKPVLWAVEKGITNGISATSFGSYAVCNRAAVVTFLWRAAGSPEPESTANPFTDVKETDFFYKPVLWAIENGITNGISATEFGPVADCNRAQVVTFLYRAYN